MTPPPANWKQHALKRFEKHLEQIRAELGPDASFFEIEQALIEHENAIMKDTLDALTEGLSPPTSKNDT